MADSVGLQKQPVFQGEILLCEDSDIHQHVIKSQLTLLGFDVTIASHGQECVNIVSDRLRNGKKPFDLIFMDIYMPVMGGLEAADALAALGSQAPIVALTADDTPRHADAYSAHGIPQCLGKPFRTEALWACLEGYFVPLGYVDPKGNSREAEEAIQRTRLLTSFVKRNQTTLDDISAAIEAGDNKLAHRLAHTLRGLAGLMGETELQGAARALENSLSDGDMAPLPEQLRALELALTPVLQKLAPLLNRPKPQAPAKVMDKEKAFQLFAKLEPLLLADSASSTRMADELREIPGAEPLLSHLENYDFDLALEALALLKKSLEAYI